MTKAATSKIEISPNPTKINTAATGGTNSAIVIASRRPEATIIANGIPTSLSAVLWQRFILGCPLTKGERWMSREALPVSHGSADRDRNLVCYRTKRQL